MLVLVAELTIKAGQEQAFETAMTAAVPQVRDEPGNHHYLMHRARDKPRTYLFYEQYQDRAAFDAHEAHLKQLGIDLMSFCDGKPTMTFCDLVV